MSLNSIEEIIEDICLGRMVIIMDDEDRENEGDLLMAASQVRADDVNFMAKYGRGLICLTLTEDCCAQLRLPLMVSDNNAKHATNFTVSIEAAKGVTTGISAADRAVTVRAAVARDAKAEDIVQPGHIFPLMAQQGGVLTRAGHTEAGCDLARLAGLEPAAVIVEILNEDGSMARRPDLEVFAQQHELKIGTIADLIQYRMLNENTVEPVGQCNLPTEHGAFRLHTYRDITTGELHFALIMGEVSGEEPTLVRVQMRNTLSDLFEPQREDCAYTLRRAMAQIARAGSGVVVVLHQEELPNDLVRRVRAYALEDQGGTMPRQDSGADLRTHGIGAQILADLGVRKMRAILSSPKKVHALSGFNLEVVEYVGYE